MHSPSEPPPSWIRAAIPAAVLLITFICFSPALGGEFLNWDDNLVLTDHDAWRGLGSSQIAWAFSTYHSGHYHPLTWLSFGFDYEIWGMNPLGYHLVNLVLHATTAVLVYAIILFLLVRSGWFDGRDVVVRLAAAAGALFFSIHPLRVESVAWITERRDALSGCLLVLSVLAWLRYTADPRRRWYAISLVAFALSLLSKAWGITLPVAMLLMDVYPLRRFDPERRRAVLVEKLPFIGLAIVAAIVAFQAQRWVGAMDIVEGHTWIDRIVQSGYGLAFYFVRTFIPGANNPLIALKPSFNPFEAQYLAGAVAAVIVTVIVIVFRKKHPWFLAAWLIYAVSVSPVLGLTQAGPQLVAERYSYLACLPFAVLVAASLALTLNRWRLAGVVAVVVLGLWGFQSWLYCHAWRDSISLWSRAVAQDSENGQAWYNLGSARLARGDMAGAFADLNRAIEYKPRQATAYLNRGVTRMERDPKGAIADFDQVIRIVPNYADAYVNRGWTRFFGTRDTVGGIADFDEAIKKDPHHYQAHLNRAIALHQLGELVRGNADIEEAIRIRPRHPDAYYIRGQARERSGDLDGAINDYGKALHLGASGWEAAKRQRTENLLRQARERKAGR